MSHRPATTPWRARAALAPLAAALLLATAGCADGASGDPTSSLADLAGDAQISAPGQALPVPITIRLATRTGAPRVGVRVTWATKGGGRVEPRISVTDSAGIARTQWTLGPLQGEHSAEAALPDGRRYRFRATASGTLIPFGVVQPMALSTYDGSGQVVHPTVTRVPKSWTTAGAPSDAWARFLAITPYPGGDSSKENPSVFFASDASSWAIPVGGANPVARPSTGYLSDPDMLYEPEKRELWLYYRAVTSENTILLLRSADGVRWGAPTTVVRAPNHAIVSPAVVRVAAGDWHMWSIDAGPAGCSSASTRVDHRTSTDGLRWSAPQPVTMGHAFLPPWHMDVKWVPEHRQFWALFNAKTAGTCATPALFFATSPDGVQWTTYPLPVLERGAIPQFEDIVYRSTLEYDAAADAVSLWFSGARYDGERWIWSAALGRLHRQELFDGVQGTAVPRRLVAPIRGVPPLLDAP